MESRTFDALTRRASLLTVGMAGLASLARPLTSAAKKNRKNKNKKKGDVNKLCKTQVGQCETFINTFCQGQPGCADLLDCCSEVGVCDFTGFIACVEAVQQTSAATLAPR